MQHSNGIWREISLFPARANKPWDPRTRNTIWQLTCPTQTSVKNTHPETSSLFVPRSHDSKWTHDTFFVQRLVLFFPARLDLWEGFTLCCILNKPVSQVHYAPAPPPILSSLLPPCERSSEGTFAVHIRNVCPYFQVYLPTGKTVVLLA